MHLIDTHCHLNMDNFDNDVQNVIARANAAGVTKMISIGCRVSDAEKNVSILEKYDGVFGAVAIHPADIPKDFDTEFEKIRAFASHPKIVAIGETGLDFYRSENPLKELQLRAFQKHFDLAKELKKPVIVHTRSAVEETLQILKENSPWSFVIHCFSENMEFAEKILALGGMISFTGIITFTRTEQMREVAKNIPLDRIMVETDAPFLAPPPNRGKRCEPVFVKDTAEFIAKLRGISLEEFAAATTKNAEGFFHI